MLEVGTSAPAFALSDQDGNQHSLKDYAGKWVLIYFYPKDNTPGCTKEACALRDSITQFNDLNAVVLGVSKDSEASHKRFVEKFGLPFTLLSDPDATMITEYGAMKMKKNFGKEYLGIVRMSYLIDPEGKVAKVYPKVKPAEHAAEVIDDLKQLQS